MIIAIYNRNKSTRNELASLIDHYSQLTHLNIEIHYLSKFSTLLTSNKLYDLVFIDLIEDAEENFTFIEEYITHRNTPIVFISNDTQYTLRAYNVGAIHYLVYPLSYECIEVSLNRCLKLHNIFHDHSHNFLIKQKKEAHVIPVNLIQYIEVRNKICLIYTGNDTYQIHDSLEHLLQKYDNSCFLRIHKSYAVNLNNIEIFSNYKIILKNKAVLPVSRQRYSELKEIHQQFLNSSIHEKLFQ